VDVVAAALALVGVVLAVGAGLFGRWIVVGEAAPEVRRALARGLLVGVVLVVVGTLGEVIATLDRLLRGPPELGLVLEYLAVTRHGRAVLVGIGLALSLLASGVRPRRALAVDRLVHGVLSVGLLAALAWVGHSASLGWRPLLGDLAHLIAAAAWAGSLAYLAWTPVWHDPGLPALVARVSFVGLVSVLALAGTGLYLANLHVYGLGALTATPYGLALLLKIALVALVLALAALNRWRLLPGLARREAGPLRVAVRVESALLALVLVATALLSTRAPAHEAPSSFPPNGAPTAILTAPRGATPGAAGGV